MMIMVMTMDTLDRRRTNRLIETDCSAQCNHITAGHLQATLSKLLTYGVLRSTQPPTLRGTGNE